MKRTLLRIGAGVIMLVGLILFICNIQWIDTHNCSLMVLITVVYVIATVMIMIANRKTVDAANAQVEESRKQLEESHKQFLESKRLEYMPSKSRGALHRMDCAGDRDRLPDEMAEA